MRTPTAEQATVRLHDGRVLTPHPCHPPHHLRPIVDLSALHLPLGALALVRLGQRIDTRFTFDDPNRPIVVWW